MTALKDLLDAEQVEALRKMSEAALAPLDNPALVTAMLDALDDVTTINGVEYDVRSDAWIDTACADCGINLLVEVAPKGADLDQLTSQDRTAVCVPCGTKRTAGQSGTLIYVNTYGLAWPHTNEENHLPTLPLPTTDFDLDKLSPAELAQAVVEAREEIRRDKAKALPEKRKKAKKKEVERLAKDKEGMVKARDERRNLVLPALSITVKGQVKEVPALDLMEITDVNEAVTPKLRSPYNKVLYSMGRDLLDKETTTYATVAALHTELQEHSGAPVPSPVAEAKKVKKAKKGKKGKKGEVLAAQIDPDAKAKRMVEAFAAVTGKSFEDAAVHLVQAGVI